MSKSVQNLGQFFAVKQTVNGLNQSLEITFAHEGQAHNVIVELQSHGNGQGQLMVTTSADESCPVVMDSLISMDGVQDAFCDQDGNYCEIEFSSFVVIIQVEDEVMVEVMNANEDGEYDVMESRSLLAMQLESMLAGVAA